MLRWHLQEGRSVIPKSVKPARIAENFDVFGFELTTEQLAAIDALDTGVSLRQAAGAISLCRQPALESLGSGPEVLLVTR